jgi:hypothetical protein
MSQKNSPPEVHVHDPTKLKGELKRLGGSMSDDWNNLVANQTVQCLWLKNTHDEGKKRDRHATVDALIGISPRDEFEGMAGAQLIAAHNAAMECYRRAMLSEQTFEGRRENLSQANKLSRTFTTLLEAINRHRGKGQQKVTVEHVHVHASGQAVVGVVARRGGGEDGAKCEEQPHAKQISHAPQQEMLSQDPQRKALPIASDAERPLPDARWPVARGTKGK